MNYNCIVLELERSLGISQISCNTDQVVFPLVGSRNRAYFVKVTHRGAQMQMHVRIDTDCD